MNRLIAASALALLSSQPAQAAEWHPSTAGATHAGSPSQVARAHLDAQRAQLSIETISLVETEVLASGRHRTVRFEQRHGGLRVVGGQAAVRVSPAGRAHVTVLDVARALSVSPQPSVSLDQARATVAAQRGAAELGRATTELVVHPIGQGLLVWQIDVPGGDGGRRYLVDAHGGSLLAERPLAIHALGRVYPISAVNTPATVDVELLDLSPATPQVLTGWNGNLAVTNYLAGGTSSNLVVEQIVQPNTGPDFLYDPPVDPTDGSDPFAQVGVYYHLTRMRDFVQTTLGVDTSDPSWKLVAVANVHDEGAPVDNAFFSPMGPEPPWDAPNMIGVGQGSSFDFSQDSDVFNHEYTHYLTHNAIDYNAGPFHSDAYGLSPFSGAIDEGLSDYFACTVNDDPILGEASLALLGSGRDLTDTTKSCPDDMVGESHADGEIIGSFGWTLRDMFGAALADELVWGAASLLTFGASFGDFARGIQQTADDMVTEGKLTASDREAIDQALASRGLDECDPEVPLRKDQPRQAFLIGLDLVGQFVGGDCQAVKDFGISLQSMFHYVVTPEATDESITVDVALAPQDNGELSWSIYARKSQHVTFSNAGGFIPTVAEWDYAVEDLTGPDGQLVIDASSDPPFDPSATYHLVIVHQNCPLASATLALSEPAPPTTAGAGGAGGSPGAGGAGGALPAPPQATDADGDCGCRLPGAPEPRSFGALALLALAGLFRRRRAGR